MSSRDSRPAVLVNADSRDARLYDRLIERGYVLYGYPSSFAAIVTARGTPMQSIDFSQGASPLAVQRAERFTRAATPVVSKAIREPGFAEAIGITDPKQAEAIRNSVAAGIQGRLMAAAVAAEQFELLTQTADLRLVLLRDDSSYPAKVITRAARNHGIPTLFMMHGVPYSRTNANEINADLVAVFGEWVREWFLRFGNDPPKIAVTGHPFWDRYRDTAKLTDRQDIKRRMGFDPERPLVVLAGTNVGDNAAADIVYADWPYQHIKVAMRALTEVNERHPLQVLLKLHPSLDTEVVERYRGFAEAFAGPFRAQGSAADPRYIYAADLVMCINSNIGIEAMLLDRPVISFQFGDLLPDFLFTDEDGVLVVKDEDRLALAIEAALFDPETQAGLARRRPYSLYRFNYLNDGRSEDRIFYLIEMLLDPAGKEKRLSRGALAPLLHDLSPAERASVGRQHVQQAQRELERSALDSAEYLLQRAEPYLDNPAEIRFLQGYVASQRGRTEEALRLFEEAAAAQPRNADYRNGVAAMLYELKRYAEAEAALEEALALEPRHLDALLNLFDVLSEMGRPQEALAALERAAAVAPDHPEIAERRARGAAS